MATIHRDYPIINGFVQVPDNLEQDKTRITVNEGLALYDNSTVVIIGYGSQYGSKRQSFLRLEGVDSAD